VTMTSRDDTPLFALHKGGEIEMQSTVPLRDRDDLSLAYTPGVAEVCMAIHHEPDLVNDYTWKNQVVAVSVGVIFIVVFANLILVIPGLKYAYAYLPTGLVNAVVTRSDAERTFNNVTLLAPGTAAVVLVVWGIGLALLGAGITMRRDIT